MPEENATRGWVTAEVKRQMEPLIRTMEEIKRQNTEQTNILNEHVEVVDKFDSWRRALWGNGTGPPGYLEIARAEDKGKFDRLFTLVGGLQADGFREEGKEELRKEQEENKTTRLTRRHLWIGIVCALAGAVGLESIVKPVFHFFVSLASH